MAGRYNSRPSSSTTTTTTLPCLPPLTAYTPSWAHCHLSISLSPRSSSSCQTTTLLLVLRFGEEWTGSFIYYWIWLVCDVILLLFSRKGPRRRRSHLKEIPVQAVTVLKQSSTVVQCETNYHIGSSSSYKYLHFSTVQNSHRGASLAQEE